MSSLLIHNKQSYAILYIYQLMKTYSESKYGTRVCQKLTFQNTKKMDGRDMLNLLATIILPLVA
jgi:hypothetical protein